MQFDEIIGNEELKQSLQKMVEAHRLGHSLLFCEEDGGGAFSIALALAQAVNCREAGGSCACGTCSSCRGFSRLTHPDLHFAFPTSSVSSMSDSDKKSFTSDYFLPQFRELALANPYFTEQQLNDAIGIESKNATMNVLEARHIASTLSLRSFDADYKVMVIFLPEKMNVDAANKLLKLMEEPPAGTLFLLITHKPERVLQTIRSRCQVFHLAPLTREEKMRVSGPELENEEYSGLVEELLEAGIAKTISATFPIWEAIAEKGREKQKEFCLYAENYIRAIFLCSKGLESLVNLSDAKMEKIRDFAARVNPGFYTKAYTCLENAMSAVESNANAKLVFCDLCNRILMYI